MIYRQTTGDKSKSTPRKSNLPPVLSRGTSAEGVSRGHA
jgi:hypothetical protein